MRFDLGLRLRLRRALRRTEGQHEQLRALLHDAEAAARDGEDPVAALRLLRDGLRAHFELEEGVSFPALHGLAPSAQSELEHLEREHHGFLGDLAGLLDGECSCDGVLHFGRALREHEQREERLLASLLGRAVRRV